MCLLLPHHRFAKHQTAKGWFNILEYPVQSDVS